DAASMNCRTSGGSCRKTLTLPCLLRRQLCTAIEQVGIDPFARGIAVPAELNTEGVRIKLNLVIATGEATYRVALGLLEAIAAGHPKSKILSPFIRTSC
ncbi:MAG: hypothetical protein ACE5E0_04465, partial [Terriglobia bacterium]